jgi:hypothetical protein
MNTKMKDTQMNIEITAQVWSHIEKRFIPTTRMITAVAVWSYNEKRFVHHIDCKGEKRVRIDVHDGLDNYGVFEVEMTSETTFNVVTPHRPLTDWEISYS